MLIIWLIIFIASLALLIKSSDWLLASSEKIGLAIGLSPFVIGITIVAFGTSFPELVSSFVAVAQGIPEVVVANAVGSNIANILIVIGFSVVIARKLKVSKNLIDLDLPLLAISTAIFMIIAWDGQVVFMESIFLLITYGVYMVFSLFYPEEAPEEKSIRPKVSPKDLMFLFIGIICLAIGAKFLIDSVMVLSELLNITTGIIAITAVAFGTSLPELIVSVKAALKGKSEVALGNVFGSNVFNVLVVVGLPGIFSTLPIDEKTFALGLPMLVIVTILFVFSGISKRIHVQEGILYILLYVLFTAKLFEIF